MKLISTFFAFLLISSWFFGCAIQSEKDFSDLASQTTQRWVFNDSSSVLSTTAEAGPCLKNPPHLALVDKFCFNEVPVAQFSVSNSSSTLFYLCVATHVAGSAREAGLFVVDSNGQVVEEALGKDQMEILATLQGQGSFKVYVGFLSSEPGQKVKVLAGPSRFFSLSSPSCSIN